MEKLGRMVLAVSVLLLAGCGASKTYKAGEQPSRGAPPPLQQPNHKMAECNRIEMTSINISGQISTYYNASTLVPDYLNVNLVALPDKLFTTSTHYLQIFRWAERVSGQPTVNTIPVRMYFVQKGTGFVSNPNGSTRISKAEIENIISAQNLADLDITVQNFFQRHFVVLTMMELQWDAARFVVYGANNEAVGSGDVLLPAFYANPNTYMAANPTPSLYTLHPNYPYRSSGASDNDYFQLTEQICTGFFGRVPASIKIEVSFWQKLTDWFMAVWSWLTAQ